MDSIWPEQRFFLAELLCMPSHEYIYGRVDYETLASTTTLKPSQMEEQLLTKDGKHRLKSWRFVLTSAERSKW